MSISPDEAAAISEQIKEKKQEVRYGTREYVAEYLVDKFKDDEFYIPLGYQRQFVWNDEQSSYFIESVLMGLPIPYMFFADADEGKTEIVDGAQRMSALASFYEGDLTLKGLQILTAVNGKTYAELPKEVQRRLNNASFRVVYLEEGTTIEVRQEIFRRINSSGEKLRPTEIRRGSMDGAFSQLVRKLSESELFRKLAPLSEQARKHYDNIELVTRFFAYFDGYPKFEGYKDRVAQYLDDYTDRMNKKFSEQPAIADEYTKRFNDMLGYVQKCLPDQGFRKSKSAKSTPHARFEAISVGVAVALCEDASLQQQDMEWVNNEEFQKLVRSDSANVKNKLQTRIKYVADKLLESR